MRGAAKVNRLSLGFSLAVICSLVADSANAVVFNSPDGAFTVEFPGRPILAKSQGRTDKGTAYEKSQWSVRTKDGYWSVSTFTYAKPRKADYSANVNGAVSAAKGRLVSDQPIRQDSVNGHEILIDAGKSGVIRERILWVASTLYFVAYAGEAAAANGSEVDEFLVSFEAVK
jgi:hypothetical protein